MRNTKDEFLIDLSERVETYQYYLNYFGITELFGTNWAYVSAAFCWWNEEFCRAGDAFAEAE